MFVGPQWSAPHPVLTQIFVNYEYIVSFKTVFIVISSKACLLLILLTKEYNFKTISTQRLEDFFVKVWHLLFCITSKNLTIIHQSNLSSSLSASGTLVYGNTAVTRLLSSTGSGGATGYFNTSSCIKNNSFVNKYICIQFIML